MPPDTWGAVTSTGLERVFNLTQSPIEGIEERGFGRIINIPPVNGQKGRFGQANHSAAKAGVHGFTMAIAQEAARKGVTVNAVSPGHLSTSMTETIPDNIKEAIVAQPPHGADRRAGRDHPHRGLAGRRAQRLHHRPNLPVNSGLFMRA